MLRLIDDQSRQKVGSIPLLSRRINDPFFAVFMLVVEVLVTFTNAAGTSQNVVGTDFCQSSKFDSDFVDGHPHKVDMSWLGIEYSEQLQRLGFFGGPNECTTRACTASTDTDHTYVLRVPFFDVRADDPKGFVQNLGRLGRVTVTAGDTGNANVTVKTVQVRLHVEGTTKGHVAMGARTVQRTVPSTLKTQEELLMNGGSLIDAFAYTVDDSSNKIAMTGPRIKVDSQALLVEEPLRNVARLADLRGGQGYGRYSAAGTPAHTAEAGTYTAAALLYGPPMRYSISDLPTGELLNLNFATQPCTTANKQFYVSSVVVDNPEDDVRRVVDNLQQVPSPKIAEAIVPRLAREGGVALGNLKSRLPYKFYPQNVARG
jgi:hypothetical protein